jgi:four helix bundle protein
MLRWCENAKPTQIALMASSETGNVIASYRDLSVWKRAMQLAGASYSVAARLPASERYALADQIRRSATSIPANIAEGHARKYRADYARFVSNARGSLAELETHLLLAVSLGLAPERDVEFALALASETGRMLTALSKALRPVTPRS